MLPSVVEICLKHLALAVFFASVDFHAVCAIFLISMRWACLVLELLVSDFRAFCGASHGACLKGITIMIPCVVSSGNCLAIFSRLDMCTILSVDFALR